MAQGDLDAAEKIFHGRDPKATTEALADYVSLLLYRRRFADAMTTFAQTSGQQAQRSALL